jgi:hypothetical protein
VGPDVIHILIAAKGVLGWEGRHCQTPGLVVLGWADCGVSRGGSEYQQAHTLLYDELLFQARDLVPMESWRLKDDLDLEDFGGSWLSHPIMDSSP